MSEIGSTVDSGSTPWRKSRAYFLVSFIILASLSFAPSTHALSLPLVDHLIDTLLPQDTPGRNKPAGPQAAPAGQPAASQTTQPPTTPSSTQPPSPTQDATTDTAPAIAPIESDSPPPLVGQPMPLVNSLAGAARHDEHDVLAQRIENAATATGRGTAVSMRSCGQFFGICWYVAVPAGMAALTTAYLLITRHKYSLRSLVTRLK